MNGFLHIHTEILVILFILYYTVSGLQIVLFVLNVNVFYGHNFEIKMRQSCTFILMNSKKPNI